MIKIGKNEIKKILRYAKKKEVEELLNEVNLTAKEKKSLELVDMEGYTEETAAELIKVSRRTITSYRYRAYKKLSIVFKDSEKAIQILKLC